MHRRSHPYHGAPPQSTSHPTPPPAVPPPPQSAETLPRWLTQPQAVHPLLTQRQAAAEKPGRQAAVGQALSQPAAVHQPQEPPLGHRKGLPGPILPSTCPAPSETTSTMLRWVLHLVWVVFRCDGLNGLSPVHLSFADGWPCLPQSVSRAQHRWSWSSMYSAGCIPLLVCADFLVSA